jgi:hypothetical protein
MEGINDLSSLLSIQSAINATQIHIQKPKSHIFVVDSIISNPKPIICNYMQSLITISIFLCFHGDAGVNE